MDKEYISQAEFARRVGASRQRVNKLANEGRLPVDGKGKIPYIEGLAIWETCRNIQYIPQTAKKTPVTSKRKEQVEIDKQVVKEIMKPEPQPEPEEYEAPEENGQVDLNVRLTRARVQKEEAVAKMKEIELQEMKKKYIHIDDIKRDAAELGDAMRKRLLAISKRVSTVCEGLSAVEIEIEVDKEINNVLTIFQESRF